MGKLSNLKPTPRLRGRAGQKQRDRRLKRTNYLCEDCQAEGRVKMADEVHHIIALDHGGPDTDENTANLCFDHHRKRTAEQFDLKTPVQRIGADGWPIE